MTLTLPFTDDQHERHHLGLETRREGDRAEITVTARMLNATNAPALQRRVLDELDAGVRTVRLDLSRCDRGIDRPAMGVLVSIKNAVERGGGTFSLSAHERVIEQLVVWELADLFESAVVSPSGRSTRQQETP